MGYVFDPERLTEIARGVIGLPRDAMFDALTAALDEAYPGQVATGPRRFIFNNAGGAMGQMCFLHASFSEYLILFGSPIGTEGHSGRYAADVWDICLDGEMWGYREGETERTVVRAGEVHHLAGSDAKGYRIPDHAWMLEYARGSIASMVPFGLADTFFSTLDVSVIARTVGELSRCVARAYLPDARRKALARGAVVSAP